MSDFPIMSDVSVPEITRFGSRSHYPFDELDVHQMFFVPNPARSLYTTAWSKGLKLGRQFTLRQMAMRPTRKGWCVCKPEDERAVVGVGVWRVM